MKNLSKRGLSIFWLTLIGAAPLATVATCRPYEGGGSFYFSSSNNNFVEDLLDDIEDVFDD